MYHPEVLTETEKQRDKSIFAMIMMGFIHMEVAVRSNSIVVTTSVSRYIFTSPEVPY